jgi:hypothetical protein
MSLPYEGYPFTRANVYYELVGGARIQWYIDQRFLDPPPQTFQLQVTLVSTPTADDWENVGLPVVNGTFAIDGNRREYGKTEDVHYRIVLTSASGTYVSKPASMLSALTFRDWRLVREMVRQELKRLRKGAGTGGYLLKRRRYGQPCPVCIDAMTSEPTGAHDSTCYGTGITGGYYAAIPNYYVEMDLISYREMMDGAQAVGTEKRIIIPNCKTVCYPLLESKDVFIEYKSDRRWFVETVTETARIRSYPFKAQFELRLANFSDIIYTFPMPVEQEIDDGAANVI